MAHMTFTPGLKHGGGEHCIDFSKNGDDVATATITNENGQVISTATIRNHVELIEWLVRVGHDYDIDTVVMDASGVGEVYADILESKGFMVKRLRPQRVEERLPD